MSEQDKRDPVSDVYRRLNARVVKPVEGVDPFSGYDPLAEVATLARQWNAEPEGETAPKDEP